MDSIFDLVDALGAARARATAPVPEQPVTVATAVPTPAPAPAARAQAAAASSAPTQTTWAQRSYHAPRAGAAASAPDPAMWVPSTAAAAAAPVARRGSVRPENMCALAGCGRERWSERGRKFLCCGKQHGRDLDRKGQCSSAFCTSRREHGDKCKQCRSELRANCRTFYQREDSGTYFLTNFFKAEFTVDGVGYLTSEHYYQMQKFKPDSDVFQKMMRMELPRQVWAYAQRLHDDKPDDFVRDAWWLNTKAKTAVMRRALRAKFGAHPDLMTRLIATGDLYLMEASPIDDFWGTGMDANNTFRMYSQTGDRHFPGANHLGKLLMELRAEERRRRGLE